MLVAGGCGTRVGQDEALRRAPDETSDARITSATGAAAGSVPMQPNESASVASRTAGGAAAPAAPGKTSTRVATGAGTGTHSAPASTGQPESRSAQTGSAGDRSTAAVGPRVPVPPAGPPGGTDPGAKKSAAVIASVGTLTGPVGTVLLPFAQGLQLWVKYINAQGGVNGHKVELLLYDDGGDPARHQARVQEAVEKNKAIAFVNQLGAISTSTATVQYLESKGVPVVGTDGTGRWAYTSPMYFPLSASDRYIGFNVMAMAAKVAIPQQKRKLGSIVCAEADTCSDTDAVVGKTAKPLGFELAYRAKAALTQPDYTAECLAARNAGVEVLFMMLDQNSLGRLGSSCARQGYKPMIVTFGHIFGVAQRDDPNLDGTYGALYGFPWFQSGTPAIDEYQLAMRTYGGNIAPSAGLTIGWRAGKAFEKAAAQLSEPPTTASVLDGLWSFRDDSLGGLTYPLTFAKDQPRVARACWFTILIQNKAFKSPDGYKLNCEEPPVSLY
jgi:branched-chain amino acid transport system substrate-binding protein